MLNLLFLSILINPVSMCFYSPRIIKKLYIIRSFSIYHSLYLRDVEFGVVKNFMTNYI